MATRRADDGAGDWTAVPSLGVDVFARSWGDGPAAPVVLVAGLGVSSRYWGRLGRRLGRERRVLAPDLPGFGRTAAVPGSPWPAGPNVREQADRLLAWMDARAIGRAALVGHSVGCQVVVDVATRFPDRVERIVLAAPPFEPGRRSLWVCLPRLAVAAAFEVPSLPMLLTFEYASIGFARAIVQAGRSMDYPMERLLPRLAVPTLVVHGRFDPLVSRRWSRTVAATVPGATLVEVDAAGHGMHYSAAAVTAAVVGRFARGEPVADEPADDPRRDPMGPWQPIPAAAAVALTVGPAVVAAVAFGRGPSRRAVAAAAAVSAVTGGQPAVVRANAAVATGLGLVAVAAAGLRGETRRVRWAVAGLGVWHVAVAVMTAKPTGPAR